VHIRDRYTAIGSGAELALGYMHALLDHQDDIDSDADIVRRAVTTACHFSTSCSVDHHGPQVEVA
jgi:ATP-dependent protease HslVU (ClpYQ) peptidase subunit